MSFKYITVCDPNVSETDQMTGQEKSTNP